MLTWPALKIAFHGSPDLLQVALLDYNVTAIAESVDTAWQVFFTSPSERDAAASGLRQQVPGLTIETIDVPDDDWAARSQASIRAIQIGRVIVAPPWDLPPEGGSHLRSVPITWLPASACQPRGFRLQPEGSSRGERRR